MAIWRTGWTDMDYKCITCQEILARVPEVSPELVEYIKCPFGGEGDSKCNPKEKRNNCGLCGNSTQTRTGQTGQGPFGGPAGSA